MLNCFICIHKKRQMTPKICLCVIIAYFLNTFCSTKWWTVSDIKSMLLSQKKKTYTVHTTRTSEQLQNKNDNIYNHHINFCQILSLRYQTSETWSLLRNPE